MRIRSPMLLLPALAALMAVGVAQAHGQVGQTAPVVASVDTSIPRASSTLPDSVRRVERQTGGEVLRAEPMQQDGREIYRLKVLTRDGRIRVMQDDPDPPAKDALPGAPKPKPEVHNQPGDGDEG
jgi:hypothetical protein